MPSGDQRGVSIVDCSRSTSDLPELFREYQIQIVVIEPLTACRV